MADQNIYLDNAGAGAGSIGDPYGAFAEINWTTGGANSIFDWVAGGDDVYINLKKGVTWREQLTVGTSGVSGRPVTIQAYDSGADPIISGADDVTTSGWADQGGNVWRHAIGATAVSIVVFDGSVRGTVDAAPNAKYEWTYSNPNLDVYATDDPDNAVYYTQIEAGQRSNAIDLNAKSYITIQGLQLLGTNSHAILADAGDVCSNITITSNTITNTAGCAILSGDTGKCDNWNITSNTMTYNGEENDTDTIYSGSSNNDNWTISSNTINNSGGDAINIQDGSGHTVSQNTISDNSSNSIGIIMDSGVTSATIEKNDLNNAGDVTSGFAMAIAGSNCVVRYNYIHNDADAYGIGITHNNASTGLEVYGNIISSCDRGIHLADGTMGSDGLFYNNTIYNCTHGFRQHDQTGITLKNNIIRSCGTNGFVYSGSAGTRTIEYNDVHGNGSNYTGIADPTGSNGNISVDPLFTDPANDDFTLRAGSPCIDTGADLGDTYDDALDPLSSWPDSVITMDQDDYGVGWEIGAFGNTGVLSGLVRDWVGAAVTAHAVYIYVFGLTSSGDTTQLANAAYVAAGSSNATDGKWSINSGLTIGTEYLVVFEFYGTVGAYSKLAGAEFMTAE